MDKHRTNRKGNGVVGMMRVEGEVGVYIFFFFFDFLGE